MGLLRSVASTRPSTRSADRSEPPSFADERDLDAAESAQRLYDRWTRFAGQLWITVQGEAFRRDLVEHLQRHPHLLVVEPIWRGRLLEVTVARATQVLLPVEYDQSDPYDPRWWLADVVRDMLRGRTVIVGAEVPVTITPAFVAADELLERYLDARTYEETPLGLMKRERGLDEFPGSDDESVEALNDLMSFLARHPELAGTREFASWCGELSVGPLVEGA